MINMLQFSKTIEAAVANGCGAMEAETISKNGRSLKSQMSRRNNTGFIKMKRFILILVVMTCCSVNVFAQYTVTITMQKNDQHVGSGTLEFAPRNISKEIFFDPKTPLKAGRYTGEVSWISSKNRPGLLIYSNSLSANKEIYIHEGQNNTSWLEGCVTLDLNSFTSMYQFLREKLGMNGTFVVNVVDKR